MSKKIKQLLFEYEQLTTQIIHWDSLSLKKDQFYFAVQGVFLIAVINMLDNMVTRQYSYLQIVIALIIIVIAIFNIFLCDVWYRTNRRNREWLEVRLDRANEIENDREILVQIFTKQKTRLIDDIKYYKHVASRLVLRVPRYVAFVWMSLIVSTICVFFIKAGKTTICIPKLNNMEFIIFTVLIIILLFVGNRVIRWPFYQFHRWGTEIDSVKLQFLTNKNKDEKYRLFCLGQNGSTIVFTDYTKKKNAEKALKKWNELLSERKDSEFKPVSQNDRYMD